MRGTGCGMRDARYGMRVRTNNLKPIPYLVSRIPYPVSRIPSIAYICPSIKLREGKNCIPDHIVDHCGRPVAEDMGQNAHAA